ncbi:MAG: hypothetical protein IJM79_03340 [Erysipelotrichaceae bacterium]|nr:hypothetical protein [Erysipelotrichaceae bacterium]
MIALKQAIRIAREYNPDFDIYSEYKDAYVFCREEHMYDIGGEGTPLVVLKDTGEPMSFTEFLLMKPEDEEPIRLQVRI